MKAGEAWEAPSKTFMINTDFCADSEILSEFIVSLCKSIQMRTSLSGEHLNTSTTYTSAKFTIGASFIPSFYKGSSLGGMFDPLSNATKISQLRLKLGVVM